ncbi:MAG TPA: hypothetical protein ENI22_02695 [Candidatus Pacearchaeota archaeon]|nr:hypothetical protein [Candidatus Pacearchaeota archaeon]
MRGGSRLIVLLLYLIFGLYFLNYPLGIFTLPEAMSSLDPWIIFVGGILILFGGINYFRAGRYRY